MTIHNIKRILFELSEIPVQEPNLKIDENLTMNRSRILKIGKITGNRHFDQLKLPEDDVTLDLEFSYAFVPQQ